MSPDASTAADGARFAAVLEEVASRLQLDATDTRLLRLHGVGIYLLPRAGVIARLADATAENRERADLGLRVTGWLVGVGFPAIRPVGAEVQEAHGVLATFWEYLPQPEDRAALPVLARVHGTLLRELHGLPPPPFRLPVLDPFARLRAAIELDDGRPTSVLPPNDRAFLADRMAELDNRYAGLSFPLGRGLIHNDAHIGNLLVDARSPHGYVLTDWESARWGPREVDLVQEGAPGNRFRESGELRRAFTAAYGYDIAGWEGWTVLRDVRDLHSLAAYVRTAQAKPAAAEELRRRLGSLGTGDRGVPWRAVR